VQNARWGRIPTGVNSSIYHQTIPPAAIPNPRRCSLSAEPRHGRVLARIGEHAVTGTLAAVLAVLSLGAGPAASSKPAAATAPGATAAAAPHDTTTRKALVIEGDNHLFMISAPDGWVLDDTAGMGSRIRCVFYPKGQKWSTAPTVMYVNPLHGYGAKARTVSLLIAEDEKSFKKNSPHGKVSDGGTIQTTGKKTAVVRYFSSNGGPAHEAVAYVPEAEMVMLLVLSSKTPQGFQGALAAYREMVQSYAWVASNAELGR
jgi:hypothetical protein